MARKNTPSSYACGSCGKHGHNARTCTEKKEGTKSATQIVKEMRAAKRAIREARKLAKAAKTEIMPVETASVEAVVETPVATVSSEIAEAFGMFDLPNVIVQDVPAESEEIMGMVVSTEASDEDAEAIAILRMLGISV